VIEAPHPTHRLIPSRYPPVGLFDTVATAADLEAAMELEGWTNDRLVATRLTRLPRAEWVFTRPNASIVMAAFLHAAPSGLRFNGPDLGAWYGAFAVETAIVEVAHHLRRELAATGKPERTRRYRQYLADLDGVYEDLRGVRDARMAPDDYSAGQAFGETLRASGGAGLVHDSVRHTGGTNIVCYRPHLVGHVRQAAHVAVTVRLASRIIDVQRLSD
jgi:hypothetical protein